MGQGRRPAIQMKIVVVYVYAGAVGGTYENYTARFLNSYNSYPPGITHDTAIIFNGVTPTVALKCMFSVLPNCGYYQHDNSGYDIGAFQFAARTIPCDMMVFFGASTYFNRQGWLTRMLESYKTHGNAQYGAMGNRGDMKVKVWPHIRTTAFWMHPGLMNSYGHIVTRPEERHPFEHGRNCFTSWVSEVGLKSFVVTWNHVLEWANWDDDPNGFQRGDESSLLAGDHICEPPYYPSNQCRYSGHTRNCSPWNHSICWTCLSKRT